MAKRIVEEMKAQGMKGVVELDAPKAYPDYYALSQLEPDYVLFVYESAQCKVKITRVQGLLGDRLGTQRPPRHRGEQTGTELLQAPAQR